MPIYGYARVSTDGQTLFEPSNRLDFIVLSSIGVSNGAAVSAPLS